MGRVSICPKTGLNRGAWSPEEDRLLVAYISRYGHWNWSELPKFAGLSRSGKSCRLRWKNYLQPHIKRGNYSKDEDELIIRMHQKLGNKWSAIAACLPGRTDNEIKNRWHTHLKKATGLTSTTNGVRQEKPQKCETPKKKEHVENSLENFAPATLVMESSIVHPIPPEISTDNSLPFADFDAVIDQNLVKDESCISQDSSVLTVAESPLNQTFLAADFYFPEHSSPLFSLPPSVESFHPRDIFDGFDMDIFSSNSQL